MKKATRGSVLIVEDDNFKLSDIESFLDDHEFNVARTVVQSVGQAVIAINDKKFDLIILDMALPSQVAMVGGAQPLSLPTGGVEVLLELDYLQRLDKVIILTQYPEIQYEGASISVSKAKKKLNSSLGCNIISAEIFEPARKSWKLKVREALDGFN